MTWARLDDQLHADPRLEAAGLEAFGLFCAALTWMGAFLTDGVITAAQVKRLAGRRGVGLAGRLVAAGFWEVIPGTSPGEVGVKWGVISWETYLISRREVEANRARKSSAGRVGAERTNAKRLETGPAGAAASAGGGGDAPDPVPIPSRSRPREEEEKRTPTPSGVGGVSLGQMAEGGQALPLPGFEGLPAPQAALEESIFAAYLEGRAKHVAKGSPPVLDEPRRKMIRGRLAAGFTADDLRAAARGIWLSDWHVENKRTGFELCMRSAEAVERCRGFALDGPELGDDSDPCPPEPAPRPLRYPPGMKPGDPVDPATLRMLAERFPACAPTIEGMLTDG